MYSGSRGILYTPPPGPDGSNDEGTNAASADSTAEAERTAEADRTGEAEAELESPVPPADD